MSTPGTPTTLPLEASGKNPFFRPKPTSNTSSSSSSTSTPPTTTITPPDYTLPISTLLREGTKIAHVQAEHSPGAIALATGTLPLKEYLRYLVVLWVVYSKLEEELDGLLQPDRDYDQTKASAEDKTKWADTEAVMELWGEKGKEPLSRRDALQEDIEFYTRRIFGDDAFKGGESFEMDSKHREDAHECECLTCASMVPRPEFPIPTYLRYLFGPNPPQDLQAYTKHITSLAKTSPGLLLAHAYVRYLGDLSGGQLVSAKIKRLYDLKDAAKRDSKGKTGLAFYDFDMDREREDCDDGQVEEARNTAHERKLKVEAIKHWFRDMMDSWVDDESLKGEQRNDSFCSGAQALISFDSPPRRRSHHRVQIVDAAVFLVAARREGVE